MEHSGLAPMPLDLHTYQAIRQIEAGGLGLGVNRRPHLLRLVEMMQPGSFFCKPLTFYLDVKRPGLERNQLA